MKKHVIIVAGGVGKRMKSDVPKQFLRLKGIPLLMHSIKAFRKFDKSINIILALPENKINAWKKLCKEYFFTIPHTITAGGNTRFHSVKNALSHISLEDCLIAVHDGVRPLVSQETIHRVFSAAAEHGAAAPCIKINDSLRMLTKNSSAPVNREKICIIQTPQCFKSGILKKAYEQKYIINFTDDATVVENIGKKIYLVAGNAENIKITTRTDLAIAEALMSS